MHKNILKKCLDELQKADFSKDYVRGMLETLYDLQGPTTTPTITGQTILPTPYVAGQTTTEEEANKEDIPPHLRPGPIGTIR